MWNVALNPFPGSGCPNSVSFKSYSSKRANWINLHFFHLKWHFSGCRKDLASCRHMTPCSVCVLECCPNYSFIRSVVMEYLHFPWRHFRPFSPIFGHFSPIFANFRVVCLCKSRKPGRLDPGSSGPRRVLIRSFTWWSPIGPNVAPLSKRARFVPKNRPKGRFLSRNDCTMDLFCEIVQKLATRFPLFRQIRNQRKISV